ncbi:hypothetical protein CLOM_g18214, partial [Closterium sp. NIES-68]
LGRGLGALLGAYSCVTPSCVTPCQSHAQRRASSIGGREGEEGGGMTHGRWSALLTTALAAARSSTTGGPSALQA